MKIHDRHASYFDLISIVLQKRPRTQRTHNKIKSKVKALGDKHVPFINRICNTQKVGRR